LGVFAVQKPQNMSLPSSMTLISPSIAISASLGGFPQQIKGQTPPQNLHINCHCIPTKILLRISASRQYPSKISQNSSSSPFGQTPFRRIVPPHPVSAADREFPMSKSPKCPGTFRRLLIFTGLKQGYLKVVETLKEIPEPKFVCWYP
jgi:hypothetical protein